MKQLVVHTFDEASQGFKPAYCVVVNGTVAITRAMSEGWEQTAEAVQAELNRLGGELIGQAVR